MMRILIPLDGSRVAEEAVRHAKAIAQVFPAELVLIRTIAESDTGAAARHDSLDLALWRHQAQTYLDGVRDVYADVNTPVCCEVLEGNAAEAIVDFMAATKPDLLVLTRYGRGNAQDFAAGGTAQKIVAHTACSILLLDPSNSSEAVKHYKRILVPIDDGKESDCAVAVAAMIAKIHDASLVLLHVSEELRLPSDVPDTRHARRLIRELRRVTRLAAETRLRDLASKIQSTTRAETRVLVSSDASFAIDATAENDDCDLLILHSYDSSFEKGRGLGPVNQSLIQFSRRALFILRPALAGTFASNFRSVYLDEPRLEVG